MLFTIYWTFAKVFVPFIFTDKRKQIQLVCFGISFKIFKGEYRRQVDMAENAGGLAGGTLALGLPEFNKKREKLAIKVVAIF